MRADFAFICDYARLVRTCQEATEIDALGIARALFVPTVPYTYPRFDFVAALCGTRGELNSKTELRLIGPDGKDLDEPLRGRFRSAGMVAAEAMATVGVALTDVPFRELGPHHVLLLVNGTEVVRVPFEVAALSED
jgi:hypothetical protein